MQFLTFIFIILVLGSSLGQDDIDMLAEVDPEYGKSWIFLPDDEGNPQIAYLTESGASKGKNMERDSMTNTSIYYLLYRKEFINEPKSFELNNGEYKQVLSSNENYDSSKETKIIIHGWENNFQSRMPQLIKNAYLARDDYNIFVVDWSSMANDMFYVRSAKSTPIVGAQTALLIDYLIQNCSTNINNVHIIGHSLGAHTAGYTGMNTKSGKVARITGLDPAKPLFMSNDPNTRLDPTDAQFVDVIHTAAGVAGNPDSLGTVDFWPNGGTPIQPGCERETSAGCSHGRSYDFFAESINTEGKRFVAYPCANYFTFLMGRCTENPTIMGNDTPNTGNGSYYLRTNSKSPFAMG